MDTQLQAYEAFSHLLSLILSEDNDVRQQAEQEMNNISTDQQIILHLNILCNHENHEIRQMSCVLLRQIITSEGDKIYEDSPVTLEPCKIQLLTALQSEQNGVVRKRICDVVAELARLYVDDNEVNHWPEVLQFLFSSSTSQMPGLRESSLNIIAVYPLIFGDKLEHYAPVAKGLFWQALNDQEVKVHQAAVFAVCSFVENLKNTNWAPFQELLPIIMLRLEAAIVTQDDNTLLKAFIEMCEIVGPFVRPHLQQTLQLMIKTMRTPEISDSSRQLALEVIITLAESAPTIMKKQQFDNLYQQLIELLLSMMVEIEEEENWYTCDEPEDNDTTSNWVVAETSLDRLSCALGGKTLLPMILQAVPQMLIHSSWQFRQAGLNVIAATAEGCKKQMQEVLSQVVVTVLPLLTDVSPRVRYAACNCLGQLSTDFPTKFQQFHHSQVLPELLKVLQDGTNPRVQAHCAAAITLFCEDCPGSILVPYLPTLVDILSAVLSNKLQELVNLERKLVLESILTSLAAVAESVEEHFVPYYDQFVPSLKYIVQNATKKELRLLRGKAIECISLVGLAVGKEKFMQDASEIMTILLKAQTEQEEFEPDDPQISYMMSSWARMCKILEEDFVRFLPVVMPPLLKAASHSPDLAIIPSTEDGFDDDEDNGWEFITLTDKQKFGIKTAGLEEKATACQMLVIYARDLKIGFEPWAEDVCKIMVPHLKFLFHEIVRACAAESLPLLLECVKDIDALKFGRMWEHMNNSLLESIQLEPDTDIQIIMMDSLCKCIELVGLMCFSPAQYDLLVQILLQNVSVYLDKSKDRVGKKEEEVYEHDDDDDDDDDDSSDVDPEEQLLSKVSDVMHSLFSTHRHELLPFFDRLLPVFTQMLNSKNKSERQWALCVFDDLVEFTGPLSVKYQANFLTVMQRSINDDDAEIRQAAVYGIGILAKYAPEQYASACIHSLQLLSNCITRADARETLFNTSATDNAISAVAKICRYIPNGVPYESLIPSFLEWLPILEDREEAPHVYNYICDMIEANNQYLLGINNANLPRIVAIFADTFSLDVTSDDPECHNRLINILQHIHTSPQVWELCVSQLTQTQRQAIQDALSSTPIANSI